LTQIGRYQSTLGSEIPAFDPGSKRLFVVAGNTIEVINLSDLYNPSQIGTLTPTFTPPAGTELVPNSVAVKNGVVAVGYAVRNTTTNAQGIGRVEFFNAATGAPISGVSVGFLPDMLTFTPDGRKILVANEGEPNSYNQANSFDPEGSISIIGIPGNGVISTANVNTATVQNAGFTAFNGQADALRQAGVRIFGPNATVAQDLEPEYITVSPDSSTAYVTLQENNALAVVDINTATVTQVLPLGFKNHNLTGNGLDASDQDGGVNIRNWPIFGMYQPDAIASFQANGQTFLVTANEGDARDYTGFAEEVRISNGAVTLDATVFPGQLGTDLKANNRAGRLQITNTLGRTNASPDFFGTDADTAYEALYAFGARSFSIWDTSGQLIFDSGDQFEQLTKDLVPTLYNSSGLPTGGDGFDTRSDNKGPEPEGVVTGVVNGRTYAFIGLERVGGVIVYDVTNPNAPTFVEYVNTGASDRAPEGLTFIPATESPNGAALLILSNEVGNSTLIFNVGGTVPRPISRQTFNGGNLNLGNNGNDIIYGGTNSDTIAGFAGNDILFGEAGNDSIDGGFGNDTLIGGAGTDTLIGNIGNDVFQYERPSEGQDQVVGFVTGQDSFAFRSLNFGNLPFGTLAAGNNFVTGTTATAAVPTFLYSGGVLSFDLDGTGAGLPVAIATLAGAPMLTNNQITLI
ncbi:MAG: choice-of-anchor I family protein, partial [Pseudanabaenaceae cyanobacterium bins.68]|nr:choice-of-anchor I family protein [Pseudanabaenaceae cyanobacterium bins.68]